VHLRDGKIRIWYPLERRILGDTRKGGKMIKKVEIYFDDLTPEAQMKLLQAFQTTPEEENWDVFPIAVIEREFVDENGVYLS